MKVLLFTFQLWAAMVLAADQPPNLERAQALQRAGKLSEARSIYETLLKTPGANPKLTCEILLELSRIDLAEGRYGDALRDGYRAASLARSRDSRALKGNALTVTGLARMYSGDYRAALNDLGEALRAARDTGDLSGEITRLNNLGTVLYYEGRYAEAMQRYREALQIVDGHPGEEWNASRRQLTVANIATIYQRLGQYRNALNTYSAIRASPVVLPTTERAQLLTNMGALYRRLGDPEKALETYRGAQALYRESAMKRGEITVLNNIGIAQVLDQHAPNEALKTFDLALKIAQESGSRPLELQARLYRGETFLRINRVDDADRDFSDAALMADSLNSPEDKWKALYGIARVGNLRGDRERAQKLLQKAVGLIESLRSNADTGTSRSGFLADKRQVYDLLIDLRIRSERCDARELFRLMEQCRARSLKDLRDTRAAGDLDTVQRMIDAQTLLVEYWMNDDAVAAVWVTRDSAGVYARTGIGNFRKDVAGLSSALAKPRGQDWHSTAGRVARVLLDGVEGQLSRASLRRLIVVPDRDLGQLPFEILPISQKERLIDRIGVAYLPTASFLRAPRARRGVTFFWSRLLAAFADPAPGSGTSSIDLGVARDSTRLPVQPPRFVRSARCLQEGMSSMWGLTRGRLTWTQRESIGLCILRHMRSSTPRMPTARIFCSRPRKRHKRTITCFRRKSRQWTGVA